MTKKHFEALAKALKYARPEPSIFNAKANLAIWNGCVEAVAQTCKEFNINFNFTEFFKACGRLE